MAAPGSSHLFTPGPAPARPDGRQSATALNIRRGTMRYLHHLGFAAIPEMVLADGRRADLAAIGPRGEIWIVEIKSSAADLAADRKWPDYRAFCDSLWFATLPDLTGLPFPEDAGLIAADAHGADALRQAPSHALPAARRKAMLIRLSTAAAQRLARLEDPLALDDLPRL